MRKYIAILLLAIPLLSAWLLQSPEPVDASGDLVLASGTATLANTKISLADTYAFFDFSTDMTPWIGETIEICGGTGATKNYCVRGIISTAGTGETYSSNYLTNGNFQSGDTGWSKEANWTISDVGGGAYKGVSTASSQRIYQSITPSQHANFLCKLTATISSYSSGTPYIDVGTGAEGYALAASDGTYSVIRNCGTQLNCNYVFIGKTNTGPNTYNVDDISLTHINSPSATGHWIKKSAASVADGDAWSQKHASFVAYNSSNYTYRIIKSRPMGTYTDGNATVASTSVLLATVDGGAMVQVLGKDLSTYAGGDGNSTLPCRWINPHSTSAALWRTNRYLMCLYSSGGTACGYMGGPGGGETLGAEIAAGTLTVKNLYKITATEVNHFCTGCVVGSYFTSLGTETCDALNKVKQVTDIGITGIKLHQTPNGYNRTMQRTDAGFAPQAVTKYSIYQIGPSGFDLDLILQEDMTQIIGNEGATIYLQQEGS